MCLGFRGDRLPVDGRQLMTRTALPPAINQHLPPHLRDVCSILAAGLVRLRSRDTEEPAADAEKGREAGDLRLHCTAHQRRHAKPNRDGLA